MSVYRSNTRNKFSTSNPLQTESNIAMRTHLTNNRISARRSLVALAAASALVLGACSSDGSDSSGASDDTSAASDSSSPAPVSTASNDLGDILVDADGMTLYGFTNDTKGTSNCDGGCAQAWPPVLVDSAELPAGLDSGVFSVIERSDGTHQLQAGDWPLYLFASDAAPGDTAGQDSGGVWFVVNPQGGLIK